jgi:RNA-splicing ligase RtcB
MIQTALQSMETEIKIPKHLCYLEGEMFDNYIHDVHIAQQFAKLNRKTIIELIINVMGLHVEDSFDTIHNYIDTESMILRKGSISARRGEKVLIPMNMRDGSLICIGKGNPDWNYSAPHGAGRILSRSQAKECIDFEEFKKSMNGIYSTSVVESTIDESPMVYKPMNEIIENIKDTVDVIDIIKPIYNFKSH